MGRVEVVVRFKDLREASERAQRLATEVNNRKINVSFSYAEGDTPNELVELAEKLESYGKTLGDVISKTAGLLMQTANTFQEVDESIKF